MTNADLIAEIRTLAIELDPNHLPTGLTKLRKAELEKLAATLRGDVEDKRAREAEVETDGDHRDGCECSDCLEFGDEMDALDAKVMASIRFETQTTVTPLPADAVPDVVLVQSGSRLIWGKLINIVNRRTRYLTPLLATVELASGVRQLVAADDLLVA